MKFEIKTPLNPSFNGKRHGIQFYHGKAMAENISENVIAELKEWGYEVEEIVEKPAPKKTAPKKNETK